MKSPVVRVDKKMASWVIIDRPEVRNALDLDAANRLSRALEEVGEDKNCKVVVLTGEGRTFCSGGDIKAMNEVNEEEDLKEYLHRLSRAFNSAVLSMREMNKPVIAAVNGPALGAGFSLVLGADLRVATRHARFSMAFRNIGLAPGSGTYMLPRMVGYAKACEMVFLGREMDAEEAMTHGIVNKTVRSQDLVKTTDRMVEELYNGPRKALAMAKDLLNRGMMSSISSHCEREAEAISRSGGSRDGKEGIRAFVEKREPEFED